MTEAAGVTAVIPCYNQGAFLAECIDSLRAQTFADWRAIVVDDCSTDGETPELCDAQADDERVEVIHLEQNRGRALARNAGIEAATTEAILSLDSDDTIAPEHFETTVPLLLERPQTGIVYTDYQRFGRIEQVLKGRPFELAKMYKRRFVWAGSLFRKSAWAKTDGYRDDFRDGNEDYDLWLSIVEAGYEGRYVPRAFYRQRCHEASWTESGVGGDDRVYRTRLKIVEHHRQGFEKHGALRQFLAMTYRDEAMRLSELGEWKAAVQMIQKAVDQRPMHLGLRWQARTLADAARRKGDNAQTS